MQVPKHNLQKNHHLPWLFINLLLLYSLKQHRTITYDWSIPTLFLLNKRINTQGILAGDFIVNFSYPNPYFDKIPPIPRSTRPAYHVQYVRTIILGRYQIEDFAVSSSLLLESLSTSSLPSIVAGVSYRWLCISVSFTHALPAMNVPW